MSRFKPSQKVEDLKYTSGTRESVVITMPAVAGATQGDYVVITNPNGTSQAVYIDIDADGTEPTGALYVAADSSANAAYKNAVQESYTLTCPDTASATQGDYFIVYDDSGNSTAIWLDIDADGTEPAGSGYTATDAQIEVDIATGDTATQVAGKVHTAISGVISDITFTDNTDGTIGVQLDNPGDATDASVSNAAEDGAGSFSLGTITDGVLATTAIAGGALLQAAISLTDATAVDNGDGTVTVIFSDIGNATDAAVKNADDSGAGSISASVTDGASESFPYVDPGDSPTDIKIEPDTVS